MKSAVVIPLYNGANWILETLTSVLAQTMPPEEVIVVDDGSDDEGPKLVRSCKGVRLLRNTQKGANNARQLGFRTATAPLVSFLDQDDIWHPDHLRVVTDILSRHPEAPAVCAGRFSFRENEDWTFSEPFEQARMFDPWDFFPVCSTGVPGRMLIRRDALEFLGGWPARFEGVADFYAGLMLTLDNSLIGSGWRSVARRKHNTSYVRRLNLMQPRAFLKSQLNAAQDALKHKTFSSEATEARALKRIRALEAVTDLAPAAIAGNWPVVRDGVARLEASIAGEDGLIVSGLCSLAATRIAQHISPEETTNMLRNLHYEWPRGISRGYLVKKLTGKKTTRKMLLAALLRKPDNLAQWRRLYHLSCLSAPPGPSPL